VILRLYVCCRRPYSTARRLQRLRCKAAMVAMLLSIDTMVPPCAYATVCTVERSLIS